MPLPSTHVKERLSLAYIQAVVASAGAHYNPEEQPEYGIDCTIKQVIVMQNGKYNYSGYLLQCQVKSTTDWIENPEYILYDLAADAYNKLVTLESKTAILIVFRLPKTEMEWLNCTEEYLELRNCCYWIFLTGLPISTTSSTRIQLPRSQIFDPQAVNYLLARLHQNKGTLE